MMSPDPITPSTAALQLPLLIEKMDRLPSVPKLYTALMDLVGDVNASFDDIAAIISQDMAMAAQVLRVANSAEFGQCCRVVHIAQAAQFLGLNTVRLLVLSLGVFSQFRENNSGPLLIEEVWRHSVQVAAAAKAISVMQGATGGLSEEAFAAGLLHDIGKLVLADNFPAQYQSVLEIVKNEGNLLFEAEMKVFGCSHAEVGGRILMNWQLPIPIGIAVYAHHAPDRAGQDIFCPLTANHAANAICHGLQEGPEAQSRRLSSTYLESLGLGGREIEWAQSLSEQREQAASAGN